MPKAPHIISSRRWLALLCGIFIAAAPLARGATEALEASQALNPDISASLESPVWQSLATANLNVNLQQTLQLTLNKALSARGYKQADIDAVAQIIEIEKNPAIAAAIQKPLKKAGFKLQARLVERLSQSISQSPQNRQEFKRVAIALQSTLAQAGPEASLGKLQASLNKFYGEEGPISVSESPTVLVGSEAHKLPASYLLQPYHPPSNSDQFQFQQLWSNNKLRRRAIMFYSTGIMQGNPHLVNSFISYTDELMRVKPALTDTQVYAKLRVFIAEHTAAFHPSYEADNQARIHKRVEQISRLITVRPQSILDIGAGDGMIAEGMKEHWGLASSQVHALDVAKYGKGQDIDWITYGANDSIPLPDSSVDLITCLMVLHHTQQPEQMLREARRILKPGGQMLIRETDGTNPDDVLFSAAMDEMFYAVFNNIPDVPVPANYKPARQWESLFKEMGFSVKPVPQEELGNPFKPVYFLIEKK